MLILLDAIRTIENGGFVFFLKKGQKLVSFQKKQKNEFKENQEGCLKKKTFFSRPWISFNPFLWFSLDRTIWNTSRHYQFDWGCAAHLE